MNRLIRANRFRVPDPFYANRASGGGGPKIANLGGGGAKIANRRFEAIRANRSNVMKIDPKGPNLEKIQDLEIFKRA